MDSSLEAHLFYLRFMSRFVWLGLLATLILVIACFYPWVTIPSKNIVVSGVDATGTAFGKPGYLNFILSSIYVIFLVIPKEWARKAALFAAAFNLAWSVRNFLIISTCHAGICPERQTAIYIVLVSALVMLIALMLTKTKVRQEEEIE
jgi:hypothetical protein